MRKLVLSENVLGEKRVGQSKRSMPHGVETTLRHDQVSYWSLAMCHVAPLSYDLSRTYIRARGGFAEGRSAMSEVGTWERGAAAQRLCVAPCLSKGRDVYVYLGEFDY